MKKHSAVLIVLFLGLCLATSATAQKSKESAKEKFDQAVIALSTHDYQKALVLFESAYNTSPHWMILAHISTCHAKLNQPVKAIHSIEQYLETGGGKIPTDERQSALKLLKNQKKKVGELHLIVEPQGTEARLDGESLGTSPFNSVLLTSGSHHVLVDFGGRTEKREINIVGGKEHTVKIFEKEEPITVVPVTPPPSKTEPTPRTGSVTESSNQSIESPKLAADLEVRSTVETTPSRGVSTPFFVAIGLTGAGVITGGIGWGFYAYYRWSENDVANALGNYQWADLGPGEEYSWSETCNSGKPNDSDTTVIEVPTDEAIYYCEKESLRQSYEDSANRSLIPAIVGTSVAAVAAGTAILFYFHPEWFEKKGVEKKPSIALTPVVSPTSTGLFLSGTF